MKKVLTYALLLLIGVSFGAAQASAETNAEQRMTNKIAQKVQKSKKVVKMKAIPEKAFAPAYLFWWNADEIEYNAEHHYKVAGESSNRLDCYAILCNYKDEKGVGVVTVALDKRCLNTMSTWNDSDIFRLEIELGNFGGYNHNDPYSYPKNPYYFSMTVPKTQEGISRVFFYTKAKNGTTFYTLNMPIRSPELKKNLKDFFAKNGSISMERAGSGLKMMKNPALSRDFRQH